MKVILLKIYHVNNCKKKKKKKLSLEILSCTQGKKCLECQFKNFCFIWDIHGITQYFIIVVVMLHLVKEVCWKKIWNYNIV